MVRASRVVLIIAVVTATLSLPLFAQDFDEDSKLNTNLGVPVTVPLSTTSNFSKLGTGVTAGAGYNFNRYNAFVGEFMWNWLYPTDQSLAPLRATLPPGSLNGHSNLFVLSANYRLEGRGQTFGAYLIGGVGLYYRNASLTRAITVPAATPCTPEWTWWGFSCAGGTVIVGQTRSSFSSGIFGGNAGMGVTVKVGEPRYRLYFEARYHYAPDHNFSLRFIPITTGIRF